MTEQEGKLEIAAGEYGSKHRASYGYPTYICLVDAFLAGAKYQQAQMEEELKTAIRDKDMCWLAYKIVKEQLEKEL